ncbi:unnamed protein product [Adineta ricciae]|uniref:Uncharacterized protein n=1 Tax=Adineta ricciae TaxID=249248 RepID=A0A814PY85_ADIRI|nr:unnamed protein product [Adineta ricciae]CAF1112603.1 unnamed protein product [Adineta ricciae]
MPKPADDQTHEGDSIYPFDNDDQPMHSMISLYWNGGEKISESEDSTTYQSTSSSMKYPSLVKIVPFNYND